MKRKVDFYQKYIMKLKMLVEEDQQDGTRDDMEDMYNQIKEEASEME
jgi:DNA-binding transcriptional regulator GbsR (MarR family)